MINSGSVIPSHAIASGIMSFVHKALDTMGLDGVSHLDDILYSVVIIVVALFVALIVRRVTIFVLRKILSMRRSQLARQMVDLKIGTKCTHIITPLVVMSFIPWAFKTDHAVHTVMMRVLVVWLYIAFAIGINSLISLIWLRFDDRENEKKHPLRGLLISAHGVVWVVVAVSAVAEIMGKSPGALLTGMAAMSAALLLIFKDSILGFVSGILLSQNDMIRVGDWIIVPGTQANGSVEDVTLTVVKVRNWDNTLVMLPPYTLISGSFQNYRGMYEIGRRLIEVNFIVDIASIKSIDSAFIDGIQKIYPCLQAFIDKSLKEGQIFDGGTAPVNGSVETNTGLFRAYLCNYLLGHPCISRQEYLIVRFLPPVAEGAPLQIWCYADGDATSWVKYEAVRSHIVEHVISVAQDFGVVIYNTPDRNTFEIRDTPKTDQSSQYSAHE
ncbi:MAG: mechanosensitive ion channel family protein [Muribaculaceae bacterium]|nr:mechanosensitive ion channel family protein [Muribaculaceae bacterium]MDE6094076.1 mechanosensitive ion channel family protein [Muribaculaceae bacterium]